MIVESYKQYSVVSRQNALAYLGDERFAKLERDALLKTGPQGFDGFYSWNVEAAKVKVWPVTPVERSKPVCQTCGRAI